MEFLRYILKSPLPQGFWWFGGKELHGFRYTYIPPTPKPTRTPKPNYEQLNYHDALHNPEKYRGRYVKFNGVIFQVHESVYSYTLKVATKYEKFSSFDWYDTDDYVIVQVYASDIKGGIPEIQKKVTVKGQYNGNNYGTGFFTGETLISPEIDASYVKIK